MNKGFTLIELLVVVLIIGILSAVAIPQYTTAVERSRASEGITLMGSMAQAIERYRSQKDQWPTSFSQLDLEIPQNSTGYGGKLFTVTFEPDKPSTNQLTITATRNLTDKQYVLKTIITDNTTSGLFTRARSCSGNDDFCNAITGGNKNGF